MSSSIPVPPQPPKRAAGDDDPPAKVSTLHTPRQNHLLAALPQAEYERLLPHLQSVELTAGSTIHGAGEPEPMAHFITAGIVTKSYLLQNGETAEFATIGSEGIVGTALFLDGGSTRSQAMVIASGHAYLLRGDLLKSEFERSCTLRHALLRYTQALMTQIAQTAVCNRHHPLEQRLCRWILLCLDSLASNKLVMTQEQISHVLGVRRESVTEAAGALQQAGLIDRHRGTIVVLDRPRLEERVCECYAVVKKEYDRLLQPVEKWTAKEGSVLRGA